MTLRGLRVSRPIRRFGCAFVALPFVWCFLNIVIHIFASAKEKSRQVSCISNVKQIELSVVQYSADWDETFPPSAQWAELSDRYMKKASGSAAWHCPDSAFPFSYASNKAIGGQTLKYIDDVNATIYLFESDASIWNVVGGKENLPPTARHSGGNTYGFMDGHTEWLNQYGVNKAYWQPHNTQTSAVPAPNADSEVLNFILAKQYGSWKQGFVIERETMPLKLLRASLSFDMRRRRHPAKTMREAFDDFARRNAAPQPTPPLNIGKPLKIVPGSEIDAIFKHYWWDAFYKKYPHTDGFLAVSLPGYSADHSVAIVFISRGSGGKSGDGELLMLVKKQNKWTVKEFLAGWVS